MNTSDLSGGPGVSGDSGERMVFRASPSVSKTQWANFALRKLAEGYVLLQGPNGRVFNFYKPGTPLQPCATHAARRLIDSGLLQAAKTDARGTHFIASSAITTPASLADPDDERDDTDVDTDLLEDATAGADILGESEDLLDDTDSDADASSDDDDDADGDEEEAADDDDEF